LFTISRQKYSLKVIEQHVGYKRKPAEYGGQRAMAMFIEATETSDEDKRKQLMDEILAQPRRPRSDVGGFPVDEGQGSNFEFIRALLKLNLFVLNQTVHHALASSLASDALRELTSIGTAGCLKAF